MRFVHLATRNLKEIYRDPVSVLLGLAMPLAMLFLFATIEKRAPIEMFSAQHLTPGIIIFSFTFLIMFAAMLMAKDKEGAFLTRLLTTPLKASDYIVSYMLPFLPLALLQITVCMVAGTLLGASFTNIALSLLPLLLIAFACINLGVMLGALFTVNQISGIGSVLITAIGLFSNIWMDLKMVGGIFETIGYAMPFAHAVDAAKGLLMGKPLFDYSTDLTIALAYALVLFGLAVFAFRKILDERY